MARKHALRLALGLAAGSLAAAAVSQVFALGRERSELLATARELEVDSPELDRILRRAEDPDRARVTLARTLLVRALEADPALGASLIGPRLEEADRLARAVLERQPASWEAATLAGAATYLAWSLDRDPRLLQEYRRWEEPLLLGRRLAPGQPEPGRYLAAAYLELWPALSDAKRDLARELVAGALADRRAFGRLIEPWLEISGGDLRPVPDTPWAWTGLEQAMARRRDWTGFCHAWAARRKALGATFTAQLGGADRLLRRGELLEARKGLFTVVASAPADRAFVGLVDHALRAVPYGPVQAGRRRPFAEWLLWSLDEALRGDPPLGAAALGRLRAVVTGNGSADPRELAAAAWTYLVAGDLAGAERVERRGELLWTGAWAPYWIEKARFLAAEGAPGAEQALTMVHPDWRNHAAYWQARRRVAEAAGDRAGESAARAAIEALEARAWSALDWSWRGGRARLDLVLGRGAESVRVSFAEVPAEGAAVALILDGATLGCLPVTTGEPISYPVSLPPGLHRLELETVSSATGRVWPGPVEIQGRRRAPGAEPAPRGAPPPPLRPAPPE